MGIKKAETLAVIGSACVTASTFLVENSITLDGEKSQEVKNKKIDTPLNQKNQTILQKSYTWAKDKFSNAHSWLLLVNTAGTLAKIPATIRGNATYAFYQQKRIEQIQQSLGERLITTSTSTNTLFLTLTQQYNKNSFASCLISWCRMRSSIRKFKDRLRKIGMENYVMALEAHEGGGCHAHIAVMFDSQIEIEPDAKNQKIHRVKSQNLRYKLRNLWAVCSKGILDDRFIDIQAAADAGAVGYITKELKKVTSCEAALKRISKDEDTPADRKKLLTFFFADLVNTRLLFVSKGLSKTAEPTEAAPPTTDDDLINIVISQNSIKQEPELKGNETLFTTRVYNYELLKKLKKDEISAFTGAVDPDTPEYKVLYEMINTQFTRKFDIDIETAIKIIAANPAEFVKLLKIRDKDIAEQKKQRELERQTPEYKEEQRVKRKEREEMNKKLENLKRKRMGILKNKLAQTDDLQEFLRLANALGDALTPEMVNAFETRYFAKHPEEK